MTNVNHAYCPQKKLRVSINLASDMEGRGQDDPAGLGVLVLHLISGTWLGEIAISANHMPKMWVTKFWGAGRGLYTTVALTLPGLNSQSARQQKNPLTVLLPGDIMASVHNSLIWLQKHYDASEQRIQVSGEGGGGVPDLFDALNGTGTVLITKLTCIYWVRIPVGLAVCHRGCV